MTSLVDQRVSGQSQRQIIFVPVDAESGMASLDLTTKAILTKEEIARKISGMYNTDLATIEMIGLVMKAITACCIPRLPMLTGRHARTSACLQWLPHTASRLTNRVLAHALYQHKAAVFIQQRYRGCLVSRTLKSIQRKNVLCRHTAAAFIQQRYRTCLVRRHLTIIERKNTLYRHKAAVFIQQRYRGCLVRRHLKSIQRKNALYRHKAAVFIQQRYRGCLVRRRLKSIQRMNFDYKDGDLDDIFSDDIGDLVHFDKVENDLSGWSPQKPKFPEPDELSVGSENMPLDSIEQSQSIKEPRPKTRKLQWETMLRRRKHMKRGGSCGIAVRSRR